MYWHSYVGRLALVLGLALLILPQTVYSQGPTPAQIEALTFTVDGPTEAVVGHRPVAFTLTVRNRHPEDSATFNAVISLLPGLEGPVTVSQPGVELLDSQGRHYRWTASVAAGESTRLTLEAFTATGDAADVDETGIQIWLESDRDRIEQSWPVVLVEGEGDPQGQIELLNIQGRRCSLGEDCTLVLEVRAPDAGQFIAGPFTTEGCTFIDLPDELRSATEVTYARFFLRVVRSDRELGCAISVPVTLGETTWTVRYLEPVAYLPLTPSEAVAAGQTR